MTAHEMLKYSGECRVEKFYNIAEPEGLLTLSPSYNRDPDPVSTHNAQLHSPSFEFELDIVCFNIRECGFNIHKHGHVGHTALRSAACCVLGRTAW